MFKSLLHLLHHSVEEFPENTVLYFRNNSIRYKEFEEMIHQTARALEQSGIQPGDAVAILSTNRPEWTTADFAVMLLKGIVVPVYPTLPANQIAYILNDAGVKTIFVEDQEQLDKINEIRADVPALHQVISFEKTTPEVLSFAEMLQEADRESLSEWASKKREQINEDTICSIVYTSGTTGEPKGVMLHHKGFVTDIISSESVLNLRSDDVFLSFLPLSHLYERLAGHWCPMYRGGSIYYARSIQTVVEDVARARPTVIVSVPRLYEKIEAAVMDKVEKGSVVARFLFNQALKAGRRYHNLEPNYTPSFFVRLKYAVLDKLVLSTIREKLGGRLRFPIAGGAPLAVRTLKFFEALGLRIIEGYGMTETHLIITLTPAGKTHYGSCGKPVPHVGVKIAADGEVLVKGPTLMAGYYNKPEQTRDVMDSDGWLHTGDVGYMDEDGYLYLTDRKKNILVTSGGKNVAAAPIENKVKTSRYIEDVCLIGNHRKFISALIVPNVEMVINWAQQNNVPFEQPADLLDKPEIIQLFEKELDTTQADLARFEKIKKFILIKEALSVDKGELTPSLKIKRDVLEKKYAAEIDLLYEN